MFFISFIICIILSVNTVQPINGDASATDVKVQQIKNQQLEGGYSEGSVVKIDNPTSTANNESVNLAKSLDQTSLGGNTTRHRGIKKTDIEQLNTEPESNNTKISTLNSNTNSAIDNSNHSQRSSQVEQKSPVPIVTSNTQTKIENPQIKLPPANDANKTTNGTSTSTTTSTTTTTTTTTTKKPTTTTTSAPKKPTITHSVEDDPALLIKAAEAKSQPQQPAKYLPPDEIRDNEPLSLQSSETISYSDQKSSHNFVMLIIGVIVLIPLLVLMTNCAVRRVRDYWSKRRYRRMDYLIEDMYN